MPMLPINALSNYTTFVTGFHMQVPETHVNKQSRKVRGREREGEEERERERGGREEEESAGMTSTLFLMC